MDFFLIRLFYILRGVRYGSKEEFWLLVDFFCGLGGGGVVNLSLLLESVSTRKKRIYLLILNSEVKFSIDFFVWIGFNLLISSLDGVAVKISST